MKNDSLPNDHVVRAGKRLKAIDTLFAEEAWADVVRESQEAVELALKGLLRSCGIEVPRIHDVSEILLQQQELLPAAVRCELDGITEISRALRRDRELSFYGSDDLTPSDFYKRKDATLARDQAGHVVAVVSRALGIK